jgi:acyl-CoA thioester hydrolase
MSRSSSYDYQVAWADLDANNHLKNTRYLDYAAQTRFRFLADHGFPPAAFAEARLGPVVFEDRVAYRKELRLLESFTVRQELRGHRPDGSRFIMLNRFFNAQDELCAEVTSHGAWFSLKERKIVVPPTTLFAAMDATPRADEFEAL